MVADPTGEYLLGVQIVGEGATELIHVGQMALQHGATVDSFIENIFNFPTLAETYRVAALDIVGQRQKKRLDSAAA
jgi:NAD(P) transhydrogenase